MSPVLKDLREATGDSHRALEARLPFMSANLNEALYRRLIQAYYGFYQPLEQRLEAADLLEPERRKAPALLRDLQAMGIDSHALERCQYLPDVSDPWHLLGVMYVIEGATLGGQVLRRVIGERLGIGADSGGAFLDVYGPATGTLWKAFLKRLWEAETDAQRQQVVAGAHSTFLCFQRWLEQAGVLAGLAEMADA
ncbi:biliverdin-producing heme oxygenase [Pseudomonas sp. Pseusp122]|uniref:biliverdin-producing heme oxygenase n=1 Tax=unclassified Pseudomonas TaxID=196821 RepID=UPI0039A73878